MMPHGRISRVAPLSATIALLGALPALAQPGGGPPQPPPPGFGVPLTGLTSAQLARYQAGQQLFGNPATIPGGLGPVFNGQSCTACHAGPAIGGSSPTLATRIGALVNGQYSPLVNYGGPSIQSQGIGVVPGANFVGEAVPPQANVVARRRSNALYGLGLVDSVPISTFQQIIALQQENDPTVAGRMNVVVDSRTGQATMGKFGWKAQKANLYDFVADASKDELGVTTAGFTVAGMVGSNGQPIVFPFYPSADGRVVSQENPPQGNATLLNFDPVKGPNTPNDANLLKMNDFLTMLAPPPRGPTNSTTQAGQALFSQLGCASCHVPTLATGPNAIGSLNGVLLNPYSDFLLHPMGSLGDGIQDGSALGSEIRTQPLWGVSKQPFWLHDGRAGSIDQAIRLHDGQGFASGQRYGSLSQAQRSAVLAFLNSL